jgi:hypothetical protein
MTYGLADGPLINWTKNRFRICQLETHKTSGYSEREERISLLQKIARAQRPRESNNTTISRYPFLKIPNLNSTNE